jgi:hypothetical protein
MELLIFLPSPIKVLLSTRRNKKIFFQVNNLKALFPPKIFSFFVKNNLD